VGSKRRGPAKICLETEFWICCRAKRGSEFNDLSSMPQRQLLSFAPRRGSGFSLHAGRLEAVEMSFVRAKVLCVASGSSVLSLRALRKVREFRPGPHFAGPSRIGNADLCQALPAFPRVPLRSLPGKILQHPPLSAHRAVRNARCGAKGLSLRHNASGKLRTRSFPMTDHRSCAATHRCSALCRL
jgi:hypothetical protein